MVCKLQNLFQNLRHMNGFIENGKSSQDSRCHESILGTAKNPSNHRVLSQTSTPAGKVSHVLLTSHRRRPYTDSTDTRLKCATGISKSFVCCRNSMFQQLFWLQKIGSSRISNFKFQISNFKISPACLKPCRSNRESLKPRVATIK